MNHDHKKLLNFCKITLRNVLDEIDIYKEENPNSFGWSKDILIPESISKWATKQVEDENKNLKNEIKKLKTNCTGTPAPAIVTTVARIPFAELKKVLETFEDKSKKKYMIDENSFKEEKNIIISMNGDNLNEINTMYTEFLKAPNTYKNIDKFM